VRRTANNWAYARATSIWACAAVVTAAVGVLGCSAGGSGAGGAGRAARDTMPPVLLTDAQLARMKRMPVDTIPVRVDPPDAIIRGPAVRIVVTDSASLPAAWTLAGAHGVPPAVDFHHDAVVLIGTGVHGGTWSVSADSIFALKDRLYVIVHEHTTCAPVDVFGRGTFALRISRDLAWHVNFVERPFESCGGHEAF